MREVYMRSDGPSDHYKELLKELEDLEKRYPKSIKNSVINHLLYSLSQEKEFIDHCETPIEVLLGLEINREILFINGRRGLYYHLHPQFEIETDNNSYRVDFLLAPVLSEGNTSFPNLVIECDGHDYHERTKKQAQRDRSRDRDLQKLGFRVVRFTGSEIFSSPRKCAWEVASIVKQTEKELGFGD